MKTEKTQYKYFEYAYDVHRKLENTCKRNTSINNFGTLLYSQIR